MRMLYVICACAALSVTVMAQAPADSGQFRGRGERHAPGQFGGKMRMAQYDASTEKTFMAKVIEVSEQSFGPTPIVRLIVSVDGQEGHLPLGSAEYLKEKNAAFAVGDELTITGVMMETPRGILRIRAREIKKGGMTFTPFMREDGMLRGEKRRTERPRYGMPGICPCDRIAK